MPELERILESGLGRVTAPDGLWERIEAERPAPGRRIVWPVAAAAMLALAAGTLWRYTAQDPGVQLQRIALREARNATLDFQTGNCAELSDWLHHNAGLNVPLPEHSPSVKLLGARVIRRPGSSFAAILYEVAGGAATLFVGKGHSDASPPHIAARAASMGGAELISWTLRDHVYTMVATGDADLHDGCRICHLR